MRELAGAGGKPRPAAARSIPAGLRVYGVGDIHGCFDLLQILYGAIRHDLALRPVERGIEIFLGDYIDRGPRSADVVEWLISSAPACDERICLLGNHEDMLLKGLADEDWMATWLDNGGLQTMQSYGLYPDAPRGADVIASATSALVAGLPATHRTFFESLPRMVGCGDYLFVHAGIRPGRSFEDQDPDDLIWIREPFLFSRADFGRMIVHGHTPAREPEVRANRINIDTGAVFNGRLTCLVLEAETRALLQASPDGIHRRAL